MKCTILYGTLGTQALQIYCATQVLAEHFNQPEGVDYAPPPHTDTILLAHPAKVASYTPVEI